MHGHLVHDGVLSGVEKRDGLGMVAGQKLLDMILDRKGSRPEFPLELLLKRGAGGWRPYESTSQSSPLRRTRR